MYNCTLKRTARNIFVLYTQQNHLLVPKILKGFYKPWLVGASKDGGQKNSGCFKIINSICLCKIDDQRGGNLWKIIAVYSFTYTLFLKYLLGLIRKQWNTKDVWMGKPSVSSWPLGSPLCNKNTDMYIYTKPIYLWSIIFPLLLWLVQQHLFNKHRICQWHLLAKVKRNRQKD